MQENIENNSINIERIIDRFDNYMKLKQLNDNKVTNDLHLSVGTIGKSRKKGRDLSRTSIEKILNFYTDLNPAWLKMGIGTMLKEADKNEPVIDDSIKKVFEMYQRGEIYPAVVVKEINDLHEEIGELKAKIKELEAPGKKTNVPKEEAV